MTFGPALLQLLVLKVSDSLNCTFIANLVYYFLEDLSQYVLFSGGIESSALAQGTANTSAASASLDHPNEEGDNSDENCNDTPRLSDSVSTPQISKKSEQSDRREKISKFLSEQHEKKMASKKSVESQQLNILKEDLQLKRKRAEQDETLDKEFLSE